VKKLVEGILLILLFILTIPLYLTVLLFFPKTLYDIHKIPGNKINPFHPKM